MHLPTSILLGIATLVTANNNGLLVNTQQGPVKGSLVDATVRQFLGVPFASAKRWAPPTLPSMRQSTLDATVFGDSCFQNLNPSNVEFSRLSGLSDSDIFVPQSEDCLTVNIWSPSLGRKQGTAVLVWIYGGAFDAGTSRIPTYNGAKMVQNNDDITLVSFNYRLNIFGQPHAPQLNIPGKAQNFGLLDIDAAIQWVHSNIANFGGDPNRISIFGQSAGGIAVDVYTFAHPNDTIVKGVIEHSGSISGGQALTAVAINTTTWDIVAANVGCGAANNDAQFACMQAVPAQTLENAVNTTGAAFSLVTDNVTIFADTLTRAEAGDFLRVPMIIGSNANEMDIFVIAAETLTTGFALPVLTEMLSDAETLSEFTCPTRTAAAFRLAAGVPTFRYQYQAIFRNISPRPDLRAWHSSELPLVFGNFNMTALPATPTEAALSKFLQSAWVAFARNPASGLVSLGWPEYNPNTVSLAQLGNFFNQSGVVFTSASLIDGLCGNVTTFLDITAQLSAL